MMMRADFEKAKSLESSIKRIERLVDHLQDIVDNGFKYDSNDVQIELPATKDTVHVSDKIRLEADDLGNLLSYQKLKLSELKDQFDKLITANDVNP